ncbi:DIP1984 family protein [Longirhabdus pacifica]|uniref:DIP1984 family protein n=1 Tax=Longirhabdus pacifica TaxID=2305227 RepID=UPI001008867C|nr:DIP1984 family protein [Longirhabdus pacifica]
MKLAEALILRADYQKRVQQLNHRLQQNVKVQEDEEPAEDPNLLLEELDRIMEKLTNIIKSINKTNNTIKLDEARTLSDALVERDMLWSRRMALSSLSEQASIKQDRFSRSEIKYISTIEVTEIQKQIDLLSKRHRELDTQIQGKNWTIDLLT